MVDLSEPVDVLVAGGGNAALCAALAAREAGARVLVLESAPASHRGGNSRHTRNLRCMHAAPTEVLTEAYAEEEYFDDLLQVTGGATDEALARLTIRGSAACAAGCGRSGVRFQPALSGTLHLGRTNAFFLGGGKALLNAYYRAAEARGVEVLYDAEVQDVALAGPRLPVRDGAPPRAARTRSARSALVAAAGGFEANLDWLREAWGDAGRQLPDPRHALQPGRACCVLCWRRAPGRSAMPGSATRSRSTPARPSSTAASSPGSTASRSASWSTATAGASTTRARTSGPSATRSGAACRAAAGADRLRRSSIAKAIGHFMPRCSRRCRRARSARSRRCWSSIPTLLEATVAAFNAAVRPGSFDHTRPRRLPHRGPRPAQEPLGAAARHAAVLRLSAAAGHHLHLSRRRGGRARARRRWRTGGRPRTCSPRARSWPATSWGRAISAGIGMTIGTVFGRIAGEEAAAHARA